MSKPNYSKIKKPASASDSPKKKEEEEKTASPAANKGSVKK